MGNFFRTHRALRAKLSEANAALNIARFLARTYRHRCDDLSQDLREARREIERLNAQLAGYAKRDTKTGRWVKS